MSENGKFSISPNVVTQQVGDETVILHLERGIYFSLDPVGSRFWQLVEQGRSVAEICETLLDEYDVSREQVERDARQMCEKLISHRLVSLG